MLVLTISYKTWDALIGSCSCHISHMQTHSLRSSLMKAHGKLLVTFYTRVISCRRPKLRGISSLYWCSFCDLFIWKENYLNTIWGLLFIELWKITEEQNNWMVCLQYKNKGTINIIYSDFLGSKFQLTWKN